MANVKYLSYEGLTYLINKIKESTLKSICESISYSDLFNLVENGELIPGKKYRINDYYTIIDAENTTSIGVSENIGFDIVVTALSTNKLSEEASAIDRNNNYFSMSNLSAWKIWYTIYNDKTKYAWANETTGKGVIYRMIDEYGNDCPYDFKSIKFIRYKLERPADANYSESWLSQLSANIQKQFDSGAISYIYSGIKNESKYWAVDDYAVLSNTTGNTAEFFTFSLIENTNNISNVKDLSMHSIDCKNNIIKQYKSDGCLKLNNIIFFSVNKNHSCDSNRFDSDCYSNSLGSGCYNNNFGSYCCNNSFGEHCHSNSFGNNCYDNSLSYAANSSRFGNACYGNSLDEYCFLNTFGNGCYNNSINYNCGLNNFGNDCYKNILGSHCANNSVGNGCYSNSVGTSNYNNSFSNKCYSNSLGEGCISNSFGNECNGNRFGSICSYNSLGNYCNYNKFANYCYYNSFGNYCCANSFRVSNSSSATLRMYCYYNHFDDGCSYNVIWNNTTANSSYKLQNIHIKHGVAGTSSAYNMINVESLNNKYCTTVAKTSSNELLIYCEEDYISNTEIDTLFENIFI